MSAWERPETQDSIRVARHDIKEINIIRETKKLVRDMDEKKRFEIAKIHLLNALNYKAPRLDTYSESISRVFKLCYHLQTSNLWQNFLLLLAYIFMYLVVWTHLPMSTPLAVAEWTILTLFWCDIIMEIYHKSYEDLRFTSRFQFRFYLRSTVLMLLLTD
jgi:hypothetical protein